jgi:riboflavin synthase
VGKIYSLTPDGEGILLSIWGIPKGWKLPPGESIAVDGVCLTLMESPKKGIGRFTLGEETCKRTTLGRKKTGDPVHLEPPLRVSSFLGGHILYGHIDGVGKVVKMEKKKSGVLCWISVPSSLLFGLVPRGSVGVDGVSLTVVDLKSRQFSVYLIPHTLKNTHLGKKSPGDEVNIELDPLGRYVAWNLRIFQKKK